MAGPFLPSMTPVEISGLFMIIFMIPVGVLLGRAAYTDIFSGQIIENRVNLALFLIGIIFSFVFYTTGHFVSVVAMFLFFLIIVLIGATAEGDFKLYVALSLFLGWASLYMAFLSWIFIIIYAIPIAIKTAKENKKLNQKAKFGQRLGKAPGGPGIALGFIVVSWPLFGLGAFLILISTAALSLIANYMWGAAQDKVSALP